MQNGLSCRCGQRIEEVNVLHQEYYLRPFGPHLVYLKFRCPACGRTSEQFIRQEEWSGTALLPERSTERQTEERSAFEQMGPISASEAAELRREMEASNPLDALNALFSSKPTR